MEGEEEKKKKSNKNARVFQALHNIDHRNGGFSDGGWEPLGVNHSLRAAGV